MNKHKCDKNGDKREGWDNCSECGETDWKGLYRKKFDLEEMLNLLTQSGSIMDELADIEADFFERHMEAGDLEPNKLINSSIMESQDISEQIVSDEPFSVYLGDRDLLVENHLLFLSKKNRMILFAECHDRIFDTNWINTMRLQRREGFEI